MRRGSHPPPATVVMVTHDSYPKDVRVWRAAGAAREAGWEVTVVCLRNPDEAAVEDDDGVHVHRLPVRHVPGSKLSRMLLEYLAFTMLATLHVLRLHARRRLAVVHINNPPDFLIAAAVIPKLLGAKVIFDVHDLSPLMFDVRFNGRRGERAVISALTLQQRLVCNYSDRVITPHTRSAERIAESGVSLRHIGIVMNPPNGAVLERILAEPAPAREPGEVLVAYHGTVTRWYGVELIVEAIALLRDVLPRARAMIIGDGDAVDDVRSRVSMLGLGGRVELTGAFVPNEQALRAVRAATCGVVPNLPSKLNELTLSGKLLDYALLGVPAIVAELPVQAAHFDASEVTFFTPGDARSLAEAIRWVAAQPQAAEAKAQRACRRAAAYSWPIQRDRYQQLLTELTGLTAGEAL